MARQIKHNSELKDLRRRYTVAMTDEKSMRFIVLLVMVASFQLMLLFYDMFSIQEFNIYHAFYRSVIIAACIVFSVGLYHMKRRLKRNGRARFFVIYAQFVQAMCLLTGYFFTVYLFSQGLHTLSVYLAAAIIVSFTHVRWPHIINVIIISVYLILNMHVTRTYQIPQFFIRQQLAVISILIVVGLGNVLRCKSNWRKFEEENELKDIHSKLRKLLHTDDLTGIYSRRRVMDKLEKLIKAVQQTGQSLCVVMLDLDNFKKINDRFGHLQGDETLKRFSSFLKSSLRKTDILGRWGGEEFIILIPESRKDDAFSFIDRIRQLVENHSFEKVGKLTFSAGICEFQPDYTNDKLIGNADYALYMSKEMGRNRVSVYTHK